MKGQVYMTCIQPAKNHYKFWAAKAKGDTVIVKWGRIGSWTQYKTYRFLTLQALSTFLIKKIREKRKHGYQVARNVKG